MKPLDHFEVDWQSGIAPEIGAFLPAAEDATAPGSSRREVLIDLIMIDLRYRWQRLTEESVVSANVGGCGQSPTDVLPPRPCLEDYVARYPELDGLQRLPLELIVQEYRVRTIWGDKPAPSQYAERFGQHHDDLLERLAAVQQEVETERLLEQLDALDQELTTEHPSGNVPSEDTGTTSNTFTTVSERNVNMLAGGSASAGERAGAPFPRRIDGYQLLEEIGRGGMGVVYKARHERMNRIVAIKLIDEKGLQMPNVVARFQREVQAAAQLSHPNIVTSHDAGEQDGLYYLVMEYVEGENLSAILKKQGRLPIADALDHMVQAADGLRYAHHKGIIHRDIKPANLLVDNDGNVKLLDMGLASLSHQAVAESPQHLTRAGQVLGTCAYMSPEQAMDVHTADARSDIYSLGCTLYHLISGHPPYEDDSLMGVFLAHREDRIPALRESRPDVSAELDACCQRMMAKKPPDRQQSMAEVLVELKACVGLADSDAGPVMRREPPATQDSYATVQAGSSSISTQSRLSSSGVSLRLAILYKRHAQPDEELLSWLEKEFVARGHKVFIDRHMSVGVEWAKEIERQVREADVVIPLLSAASAGSEMLAYEVQIAHEAAKERNGRPYLFPVRVNYTEPLPPELAALIEPLQYFLWEGPQHNQALVSELNQALREPGGQAGRERSQKMEPPLGAMPLDSEFYLTRTADHEFQTAIARQDSIVLIRGARQMGKTSLLARGLMQARDAGRNVVLTDLQKLCAEELQTPEHLFRTLGEWIADELELDVFPDDVWTARCSASVNFERYLRRVVLKNLSAPLVWGLDEVDRLFACPFRSEVFGLFRSWHNARALQPTGPWSELTMAMAYATEAHLFITDINQSPFNVGTRVNMEDFTHDQLLELNARYGSPLRDETEIASFERIVGGHPYLVNRGLYEITSRDLDVEAFAEQTIQDTGLFGDHLRRLLVLLTREPTLCDVVRDVLRGQPCTSVENFYRLRSAGIIIGDSAGEARLRCQLYASYFERHLL